MTIFEILKKGTEFLEQAGLDEAAPTALELLSFILKKSKTEILLYSQDEISSENEKKFFAFIKERAAGTPIEYITGEKDFLGFTVKVNPSVLIPRPETEELATGAWGLSKKTPARILDLCTGSGCIAAAMAKKYPAAEITASDKSEAALQTAKDNFADLGVGNVIPVQSDLFENIEGKFDLIISNPPYIPTADLAALDKHVQREPALALDGGKDGLDIIRRIAARAADYLNDGGLIALEYGIGGEKEIFEMFEGNIWRDKIIKKDIFNINRFFYAYKM